MGEQKDNFGTVRWRNALLRAPRLPSCSGPVTWDGLKLRGYSRVIWIPSAGGLGHHINLDPTSGQTFWEFTMNTWDFAYLRLTDDDFNNRGARIGVQVGDARFKVTPYGSYDPHPNDLPIALRNGDTMNVAGGAGGDRIFTAWGQVIDYWRNATLVAPWVGFQHQIQYRKDEQNRVQMRGGAQSGGSGTRVFTLPPGYRPSVLIRPKLSSTDALANYDIHPNGDVFAYNPGSWHDASPVSFIAEQ